MTPLRFPLRSCRKLVAKVAHKAAATEPLKKPRIVENDDDSSDDETPDEDRLRELTVRPLQWLSPLLRNHSATPEAAAVQAASCLNCNASGARAASHRRARRARR